MFSLGDKNILKNHKVAFLCSRQVPAEIVLKAYDWAIEQREKDICVISGFHSKIEKDVFHYLLKGNQPIILVHARFLKKREDKELLREVKKGRLLIISPFEESITRISTETAIKRNQFMIDLADEVVVGYAKENGNLNKTITRLKKKVIFL